MPNCAARRPDLELLWGVTDLSVPVPEGGRALLIESREWYTALGSSRYLCPNIDFERYFRKRPYQRYLQTFHGYPFKSMGISLWRVQGRPESVIDKECTPRSAAPGTPSWCPNLSASSCTGRSTASLVRHWLPAIRGTTLW